MATQKQPVEDGEVAQSVKRLLHQQNDLLWCPWQSQKGLPGTAVSAVVIPAWGRGAETGGSPALTSYGL